MPPKIPLTFRAHGSIMYDCSTMTPTNMCGATGSPTFSSATDLCEIYEIGPHYLSTLDGAQQAVAARFEMVSDESLGLAKERSWDMSNLHGWALEEVTDTTRMIRDTAQVWNGTNEAFFCTTTTVEAARFREFGDDSAKLLAVFRGMTTINGVEYLDFLIKHVRTAGGRIEGGRDGRGAPWTRGGARAGR